MGNRTEFTDEQVREAVQAEGGNLTAAAKYLNDVYTPDSRVTRQNLQTWTDDLKDDDPAVHTADNFKLMQRNRTLTVKNSGLSRDIRRLTDAVLTKEAVLAGIKEATDSYVPNPLVSWDPILTTADKRCPITIELLFSDLQIGKLMDDYDSEVAVRRVEEWAEVVQQQILDYISLGYELEKIVIAFLGDIIESDKKHINSGRACDIGTADQLKLGQEIMFHKVLKPLHDFFGVKVDVVMITGNHDHDGHGLNMFNPGKEHLSWPMYHTVRMLAEAEGMDAEFFIPVGSFHVHDIYGSKVLYEHGVGVSVSESGMKKHVANRTDQLKEYITLFRMG